MKKNDLLVLIDGNSLLNRAYYALPPLKTKAGEYTNAVYGFCAMMIKALADLNPSKIIVAFDLAAPTFRKELYPEYKAQRKKMPDELAAQIPILKNLLREMNIAIAEREGFEADDVLGTLAKCAGMKNVIVTGDRDAFQLIDDNTSVWLTRKGVSEVTAYDEAALLDDYGLTPPQIIEMKGLMGDASDNIPGVSGVGEKTALDLIQKYGSVNGVYAHIDEITQGKLKERLIADRENAYLSVKLARIVTDVGLPDCNISGCGAEFPFAPFIRERFRELEFNSLIKRDALFTDTGTFSAPVPVQAEAAPVKTLEITTLAELAELADIMLNIGADAALIFGADIILSFDKDSQYAVKLNRDLFGGAVDPAEAMEALRPVLESPAVNKTVFCVKDTVRFLFQHGVNFVNGFDLQLAQYVADYTVPHNSLKELSEFYGEIEGAAQALRLKETLKKLLSAGNLDKLYALELELSNVLFEMETLGFQIDTAALGELSVKYLAEINALAEKIYEACGERFNLNSPKQLGDVLFNKLKLAPAGKTKTGFSTSADVLEELSGEHPAVELILRYRAAFKLYSTYIEGLRRVADVNGVVRTSFKQAVTSTGRLSSIEPNLQNIPVRTDEGRELRRLFRARDGHILIAADYSQIELRLLAHFSGDPLLRDAYAHGADIHRETAAKIFNAAPELVTSEMRRAAKAVNFGVIYGISGFGLSQGLSIGRKKAQDYIDSYFKTYPRVKEYMDANVAFAKKHGYISTFTGRVRRIPELSSPKAALRSFGERAAMNMPLQGSAADLIKIAMINVRRAFLAAGLRARLVLQVHDELIVEAPEAEKDAAAGILKREMETAAAFSVPIIADVGVGRTWYDC